MKNNFPQILWKTGFHCSVDELLEFTFSMTSMENKFPVEFNLAGADEFTLNELKLFNNFEGNLKSYYNGK